MSKKLSDAERWAIESMLYMSRQSDEGHKNVEDWRIRQERAAQRRREKAYRPGNKRK